MSWECVIVSNHQYYAPQNHPKITCAINHVSQLSPDSHGKLASSHTLTHAQFEEHTMNTKARLNRLIALVEAGVMSQDELVEAKTRLELDLAA